MTTKTSVKNPLVLLDGDEMAQVAFDRIVEQLITPYLDISLLRFDLSAENRIRTNGDVVKQSMDALLKHRVGVKNAGITVNALQKKALIEKVSKEKGTPINESGLAPLATKSPNGAIRKSIAGNIDREEIPFKNLRHVIPKWIGRDIVVMTMNYGGQLNSYNILAETSGTLKLIFTDGKGDSREIHSRNINKEDPLLLATNDLDKVRAWAREFFARAVSEKRNAYMGLKDTVIPGYDGVMKQCVEEVFKNEFEAEFKKAGIFYEYGLIDAQAAKMIVTPPDRALWGIPDNTTGRKMYKLVEALKQYGIPERNSISTISRMSSGGGDQYGSFNQPIPDDGEISIQLEGKILHSRVVKKGDPLLFMTNDVESIRAWVRKSFDEAERKEQELYFGLKREYMPYDAQFSEIIRHTRDEISARGDVPAPFMIMRPALMVIKMITDPPRNARYCSLNLDGDIFSDITAALGGSLATSSSVITGKDGIMLFEAPHGTAPDLYKIYQESGGKDARFNASALIYAFANALEVISGREKNDALRRFSDAMKQALIDTVDSGIITGDLKGKTKMQAKEKLVDMFGFLNEVEARMQQILSGEDASAPSKIKAKQA